MGVLLRGCAGEFGLMNYYSFDGALLHITLCILGVAIDRPLYHRAVVRVYVQLLDLIDVSKRLLSMLDHISLGCVQSCSWAVSPGRWAGQGQNWLLPKVHLQSADAALIRLNYKINIKYTCWHCITPAGGCAVLLWLALQYPTGSGSPSDVCC